MKLTFNLVHPKYVINAKLLMTYFASFFGNFQVFNRNMWLMAGILDGTTLYTVLKFIFFILNIW